MKTDNIFGFLFVLVAAYLAWTLWLGKRGNPYQTLYDAQHNIDQSSGGPIVIDTSFDGTNYEFASVPFLTMPPIEDLPTSPVGS